MIAILAAITIVSYNGISKRALAASLSSDLVNASQSLKLYQVDTATYPAALDCSATPAANSICLKSSANTTYQYTVGNNTSPQTFCITATNGSQSYFINQNSAPIGGACPNDSNGGMTVITNLALNPSCESNVTNWAVNGGTGGGAATISQGPSGLYGSYTCMQTTTTASTGNAGGPNISAAGASTVIGGSIYTISGYARINKVQRIAISIRWINSSGSAIGTDITNPSAIVTAASTWQRTSYTLTAPALATQARYFFYAVAGTGGTNWNVGDTFEVDGVMVTQGATLYNYGDGNTSGWAWSSSSQANNTTSTGPSQPSS